MLCRLLIVDDDPAVVNALRRELLRPPYVGTEGIEVESFHRPLEALVRLSDPDGDFDAAIVDFRMPGMDGIVFLDYLRLRRPQAIRILLTGMIDLDGAIAAINSARIDHLLTKPWHEYDLKGRLALALHQRELPRLRAPGVVLAPPAPPRLLLVDDDESVLSAMGRQLAREGNGQPLTVTPARSAAEALAAAENACPDLVLADYLMPGTNGIELLHQLRERCPDCVRILMSGGADVGILAEAINVAGIHHFLGKPWGAGELRAVLAEALRYRQLVASG